MTDPYRTTHETTIAYDSLKDTANALQARYIALSRAATGDPDQQQAWNRRILAVRDAVSGVDPDDREAITALAQNLGRRLRELKGTG
ncbi:hypothetical protein [Nocardiopsis algeriensis]|uniref:Uncharacterized protein n=1 Tax=Nocardiopsis algeriensis TaxID=1478215 RepID=A0A841ILG3_9ACTN|nr:hypothetical protein [Nocardiopsis algeriensis]MBB6119503.1 hypothetical protein [Nocardiopsis algeriensis]